MRTTVATTAMVMTAMATPTAPVAAIATAMVAIATAMAAVAAMVKAWWQWGGLVVVLSFDKFL